MTRNAQSGTGDDGLPVALAILAVGGLFMLSKVLGNCSSSVSFNVRMLEGGVIFLQLLMLGGVVLLVGLLATRNVRPRPAVKWWAIALVLLAFGWVTSGQLLAEFGDIAACADGLFGWLPF